MTGKPTAGHVPEGPPTWRRWNDIASLFTGPGDPSWDTDRDAISAGTSGSSDA